MTSTSIPLNEAVESQSSPQPIPETQPAQNRRNAIAENRRHYKGCPRYEPLVYFLEATLTLQWKPHGIMVYRARGDV